MTRHRLFPAIVALWCAALLGLGSFAVSPQMLSSAVEASGIAAVVPAAAPPLGFTARALIALVLTGVGAIAGLVIGRRIGRVPSAAPGRRSEKHRRDAEAEPEIRIRPRDSHPDAAPRKPFLASEDMLPPRDEPDWPVVETEAAGPRRRRALAVTDESLPAEIRDFAPLPGAGDVAPLDLTELMAVMEPHPPAASIAPASDEERLGLSEPAGQETIPSDELPEPARWDADLEELASQERAASSATLPDPAIGSAPQEAAAEFDLDAVYRSNEAREPAEAQVEAPGRSPVAKLPLDLLGTVQLVERLACALADYRERNPNGPLPAILAAALEPQAPAETARSSAPADLPARPAPLFDPAAPRPVVALRHAFTELPPALSDDEAPLPEQTARFLSLAPAETWVEIASEDPLPADREDELLASEETRSAAVDGYSSLVDMTLPRSPAPFEAPDPGRVSPAAEPGVRSQQVFIRVEEPEPEGAAVEPVVLFPGQVARPVAREPDQTSAVADSPRQSLRTSQPLIDANEAERALRTALATLQRMGATR